jgi:hypothetical protein
LPPGSRRREKSTGKADINLTGNPQHYLSLDNPLAWQQQTGSGPPADTCHPDFHRPRAVADLHTIFPLAEGASSSPRGMIPLERSTITNARRFESAEYDQQHVFDLGSEMDIWEMSKRPGVGGEANSIDITVRRGRERSHVKCTARERRQVPPSDDPRRCLPAKQGRLSDAVRPPLRVLLHRVVGPGGSIVVGERIKDATSFATEGRGGRDVTFDDGTGGLTLSVWEDWPFSTRSRLDLEGPRPGDRPEVEVAYGNWACSRFPEGERAARGSRSEK